MEITSGYHMRSLHVQSQQINVKHVHKTSGECITPLLNANLYPRLQHGFCSVSFRDLHHYDQFFQTLRNLFMLGHVEI